MKVKNDKTPRWAETDMGTLAWISKEVSEGAILALRLSNVLRSGDGGAAGRECLSVEKAREATGKITRNEAEAEGVTAEQFLSTLVARVPLP